MDLGRRVRDLRNARHLSQVELAARAGVARNTLNRIENGRLMPTAPSIEHLAEALNVAPGALFEEPAVPLDAAPQEDSGPPVVHFAKLSDNAYEEVRENARTLEEREDLRHRVDVEYEQLSRWVRELREEEVDAPSGDMEEARELLNRVRKRREVAFFDVAESIIPFDEKRPPRPSRTAGKTVDEAYEEIQGKAKEGAASRPGESSREQQPL